LEKVQFSGWGGRGADSTKKKIEKGGESMKASSLLFSSKGNHLEPDLGLRGGTTGRVLKELRRGRTPTEVKGTPEDSKTARSDQGESFALHPCLRKGGRLGELAGKGEG